MVLVVIGPGDIAVLVSINKKKYFGYADRAALYGEFHRYISRKLP